jgi:hypothetical protein
MVTVEEMAVLLGGRAEADPARRFVDVLAAPLPVEIAALRDRWRGSDQMALRRAAAWLDFWLREYALAWIESERSTKV